MGNTQARRRLNAKDFQYIANNTALLNMQIVTEYFTELTQKYPDGKIQAEDFKKIFHLAFPERKQDKVDQLAEKLRNVEKTDGTIPMFTIAMLLFWFSDGPVDENLAEMFKLFDEDGNGNISIQELLSMMAFFIELGMDTGNVDMAKTMAEVFSIGDINKDEKLSKVEFVQVRMINVFQEIQISPSELIWTYLNPSGPISTRPSLKHKQCFLQIYVLLNVHKTEPFSSYDS